MHARVPFQATITTTLPHDTRFFQMWGHIHMAGYNITLYHGDSTDSSPICTSLPGYGTVPNKPGDEKGYVVSMSKCHWDDKPYIIKKGEKITLQAYVLRCAHFSARTPISFLDTVPDHPSNGVRPSPPASTETVCVRHSRCSQDLHIERAGCTTWETPIRGRGTRGITTA